MYDDSILDSLRPFALAEVTLSRSSEDRYVENIEFYKNIKFNLNPSEIISSGSYWEGLVNWKSYFGTYLVSDDIDLYAIGVESALDHTSRGAYLVNKTYIFHFPLEIEIIKSLEKNINRNIKISKNIIFSNSLNYSQFKIHENYIFANAIQVLRKREKINFRTLLISESNITNFYKSKQVVSFCANQSLTKFFSQKSLQKINHLKRKSDYSILKILFGLIAAIKGFLTFKFSNHG